MMPARKVQKSDEELFRQSTMSFGEHLEELRICLFKALGGLVVAFLFGLFVGGWVVAFIQTPLTRALTKYYEAEALERGPAGAAGSDEGGKPSGGTPEWFTGLVKQEHLLPQEFFIRRDELLDQLTRAYPELFSQTAQNQAVDENVLHKEDMLRVSLWHPIQDDPRIRLTALSAQEAFMIYVKASLLVGAILASPWIFYQIWSFVAAGLYRHERRSVQFFFPFSLLLFFAGAALAFFFVFEPVLGFLLSFNRWMGIDPDPRISEWLGFVLMLPLGFGISFQLPLVMLFLERIGVFTVEAYLSRLRIAILVIFVVSMFLTPADPYSMLLMAVPLTVLYFGGILLCKLAPRRQAPSDQPAAG